MPVLWLLLLGLCSQGAMAADAAYLADVKKWRADYDRDLLGADGPFALVRRFVLAPGVYSVGRDRSNDLVLPVDRAPARAGTIEYRENSRATFQPDKSVSALVNDKTISEIQISQPVTVSIGDMQLRFRFRESELRVTVIDPQSPMQKSATPSVWFPADAHYRIVANWVAFPEPKLVRLPDNDGGAREWKSPGYASFIVAGTRVTLQSILSPDGKILSFFFRDETAGKETYGAGRFLDTDPPKDGKVIIDFNKAYNPSCAFNTLFVCPIPPRENHLPVAIGAGERVYPHHVTPE
jgi:uncharacterized protein (DUF1684 family)